MDKLLRYRCEKKLGDTIQLAEDRDQPGQLKCLRTMPVAKDADSDADARELEDEMRRLAAVFSHEFLLPMEDIFTVDRAVHVVTPYCEGGNLRSLISRAKEYDEVLNEIEVLDWLVQLLQVVQHLEKQSACHGEISTSNIYLTNNCVRLAEPVQTLRALWRNDRLRVEGSPSRASASAAACGGRVPPDSSCTLHYTAPELLHGSAPTPKTDVWSLGCVLYELCSLNRLFEAKSTQELQHLILNSSWPSFPTNFPKELQSIWKRLLQIDPDKRCSAGDALNTSYLQEHMQEMMAFTQGKAASPQGLTAATADRPTAASTLCEAASADSDSDWDDDVLLTEENIRQLIS